MRLLLAFLLLAHGIAHVPGFLVSWQLAAFPELAYRTTVFGTAIDVGSEGTRLIGLWWLGIPAWRRFGLAWHQHRCGHRGWMNLKAHVPGHQDHTITAEAERGEHAVISARGRILALDHV